MHVAYLLSLTLYIKFDADIQISFVLYYGQGPDKI